MSVESEGRDRGGAAHHLILICMKTVGSLCLIYFIDQ